MRIKWPLILLATVLVLVGGYYYFFVTKKAKDIFSPKQEEISKADLIVKNLADKYQARTNWEENSGFTLELQEQLIADKPVIFRGYMEDVFSRDEKKFIRLSSTLSYNNYIVELECEQQIINSFLEDSTDGLNFDEYAVVAEVKEVYKPLFEVGSSVQSENYAQIEIESSDLFIIKGICIDIAHLEDNSIMEKEKSN